MWYTIIHSIPFGSVVSAKVPKFEDAPLQANFERFSPCCIRKRTVIYPSLSEFVYIFLLFVKQQFIFSAFTYGGCFPLVIFIKVFLNYVWLEANVGREWHRFLRNLHIFLDTLCGCKMIKTSLYKVLHFYER